MYRIFTDIKTKFRCFDRWRRQKLSSLEVYLYKVLVNKKHNERKLIAPEKVKKILIIRQNKRLGNTVFLIPFIRQVRSSFPNAEVSIVVKETWQRDIFDNMGIDAFYYSKFSFRGILNYFALIKSVRKKTFDYIITPYSSVGDTITAALLCSRNKISRYHKLRHEVFTHNFDNNSKLSHTAHDCLSIFQNMGINIESLPSHHIALTDKEIRYGKEKRRNIYNGSKRFIAFFRGARGGKKLSDSEWLEIISEVESSSEVEWLEILSHDISGPLMKDSLTYSTKCFRQLASILSQVDGFICCDTGPLHLANSAGATCVGFYNSTSIEKYGALGQQSMNISNVNDFCGKELKNHIDSLKLGKNKQVIKTLAQAGSLSNLANVKKIVCY